MLESLVNLVLPQLIVVGIILMAIGFIAWRYVHVHILSIMGLIVLVVGFILTIIGILEYV